MATVTNPQSDLPSVCERSDGFFEVQFQAMGTLCSLHYDSENHVSAKEIGLRVLKWVRYFELRYSRFIKDSFVSKVNSLAGLEPVPLEDEDRRLFGLCQSLNFITKGLFDPTTLPISLLWDFKKKSPEIPSDDKIKRAIELVGWKKVVLNQDEVFLPLPGMGLDFGGFGKEYAVDRVVEILKSCGVENAMVNFGGDIHALGCPKDALNWIIGIENPKEPGRPAFALELKGMAVATSGTYARFFAKDGKRFSHLIDHRTGYPVSSNVFSASVLASTCLEAGALATCSLLCDSKEGLGVIENYFGAEGCLRTDRALYWSKGFEKYLCQNQ